MIFYEEALSFPDIPNNLIVGIEGRFKHNKISICVILFTENDQYESEYFSKVISSAVYDEELTKIKESMLGKIEKVKDKIGPSFSAWLPKFAARVGNPQELM